MSRYRYPHTSYVGNQHKSLFTRSKSWSWRMQKGLCRPGRLSKTVQIHSLNSFMKGYQICVVMLEFPGEYLMQTFLMTGVFTKRRQIYIKNEKGRMIMSRYTEATTKTFSMPRHGHKPKRRHEPQETGHGLPLVSYFMLSKLLCSVSQRERRSRTREIA